MTQPTGSTFSIQAPWVVDQDLKSFPNLKITNGCGADFETNAAIFGIMCPQYSYDLEEAMNFQSDTIVILPDIPENSLRMLDDVLHKGSFRTEIIDESESLLSDLLHILPLDIADDFRLLTRTEDDSTQLITGPRVDDYEMAEDNFSFDTDVATEVDDDEMAEENFSLDTDVATPVVVETEDISSTCATMEEDAVPSKNEIQVSDHDVVRFNVIVSQNVLPQQEEPQSNPKRRLMVPILRKSVREKHVSRTVDENSRSEARKTMTSCPKFVTVEVMLNAEAETDIPEEALNAEAETDIPEAVHEPPGLEQFKEANEAVCKSLNLEPNVRVARKRKKPSKLIRDQTTKKKKKVPRRFPSYNVDYFCVFCLKRRSDIPMHFKRWHPNEVFQCPYCPVSLPSSRGFALGLHLRRHQECICCGDVLRKDLKKQGRSLREHKELLGPGHNNSCPHRGCSETFVTYQAKLKHMECDHEGVMVYQCGHCQEEPFENEVSFKTHMMLKHLETECICCGEVLRKDLKKEGRSLREHKELFGPGHNDSCPHRGCSEKFVTYQAKLNHMECVHEGVMVYQCGYCQEEPFKHDVSFKTHMMQKHKFGLKTTKKRKWSKVEPGQSGVCHVCGAVIIETGGTRKGHGRFYKHVRNCERKLECKCEECGKEFQSLSRLLKHRYSIHVPYDQRPFKCETCEKRFISKYCLKKHYAIHENKREHLCTYCGVGFNDLANRCAHEKSVHLKISRKKK